MKRIKERERTVKDPNLHSGIATAVEDLSPYDALDGSHGAASIYSERKVSELVCEKWEPKSWS